MLGLGLVAFVARRAPGEAIAVVSELEPDVDGGAHRFTTTVPLTESTDGLTSGQWGRFLVSAAAWVLLPLVLGTVRVLRREGS